MGIMLKVSLHCCVVPPAIPPAVLSGPAFELLFQIVNLGRGDSFGVQSFCVQINTGNGKEKLKTAFSVFLCQQ